MDTPKELNDILNSGDTVRFHTVGGITKHNVADHSWGVAVLLQSLWPECSKNALLRALYHDCAETVTGDVPFTVKQDNPTIKQSLEALESKWEHEYGLYEDMKVSKKEERQVKVCDCLQGMYYCLKRRLAGEYEAEVPFDRWRKYLNTEQLDTIMDSEKARAFYQYLTGQMEYVRSN